MSKVFLPHGLQSVAPPEVVVVNSAVTVSDALAQIFADYPLLRSYLLNDQGTLRERVAIYVDGEEVRDSRKLSDTIHCASQIRVMRRLGPRVIVGCATD